MRKTTLTIVATATLVGCSRRVQLPSSEPREISARAELSTSSRQAAGTATLTQTPNGVLITAQLSNLPPGAHAIHVHDKGLCDAPAFETAGGHFNPGDAVHGFKQDAGPHSGDLPNFRATDNGSAQIEMFLTTATLDGAGGMLDDDGASLVVHAGPDDYTSDPAGNSGSRIACGIIVR
ncbi:MAG TPA: superoxide dismutase family protein [Gemmatimonadaceae bacterium]|nr:superoxide dismutase family protein [Gemmatimonadaceae bacterium]